MAVFILILSIILFSILFRKREEHWLPFGKDHILRKFKQGGRTFIYEQASFGASQETVYYLFQLVYELTKRKGFSQYKYDLYDFSYNIFCYEETTLKIFRYETYIYLIRCTEPISIEEFERIKNSGSKEEKKEASEFLNKAALFMNVLAYRNQTILKVLTALVNFQEAFFLGRPCKPPSEGESEKMQAGYLRPLKQIDIAEIVGLSPSTVSRVSNQKYIRCEWGLFEIKDLFSPEVNGGLSKDFVEKVDQAIQLDRNIIRREGSWFFADNYEERLKKALTIIDEKNRVSLKTTGV